MRVGEDFLTFHFTVFYVLSNNKRIFEMYVKTWIQILSWHSACREYINVLFLSSEYMSCGYIR